MTRYRQFCALARAAELIGERWTLLIVRELLLGPRRFADLQRGLAGISPALLTQRLAHLEEAGVIRRAVLPPPASVSIYELTAHGEALRPAVLELIRWGGRFLLPAGRGEAFEPEWMRLALEACARRGPTPPRVVAIRVTSGAKRADIRVSGGPGGTRVESGEGPADVTVTAPFQTVFRLASGGLSVEQALSEGHAEVTGTAAVLADLPALFDLFEPRSGRGAKTGDRPARPSRRRHRTTRTSKRA